MQWIQSHPFGATRLFDWLLGCKQWPIAVAMGISTTVAAQTRDTSAGASAGQRDRSDSATARLPAPDPDTIARFRRIMLPQLDAAHNLARYLIRDRSNAEDCVQDAYMRALLAFPNYRGGDARSWILTIVRNCCITWLSARSAERKWVSNTTDTDTLDAIDGAAQTHPLHASPPTPDAELASLEEGAVLRELIAALPSASREVLVLREIEDLSYRQIAVIIDAPIGTVMSRLARARTQLAAAYRELESNGARS